MKNRTTDTGETHLEAFVAPVRAPGSTPRGRASAHMFANAQINAPLRMTLAT